MTRYYVSWVESNELRDLACEDLRDAVDLLNELFARTDISTNTIDFKRIDPQ